MRIPALIKKEFLQFWRDPILLMMVLWAFTADVYLCARNFSFDIRNFPVAVYDLDKSVASASLISHLRRPRFRMVGTIERESQIEELLSSGAALMVIVIESDFSRRLARGEPGEVQVLVDGTNSSSAGQALGQVTEIFSRVKLKGFADDRAEPTVVLRSRIWFNPNVISSWSVGLTELYGVITMMAILLPAAALVREKERGTIEQLLVGPLRPWQIMVSKIVPMMILVMGFSGLSLVAVLGAGFGLYAAGWLWVFLLATGIYVYACSGLGMVLASLAGNLSQVMLMLIMVLVPILFLSGTWAPAEAMPVGIRWFAHISPLAYFHSIGMGVFFKGWHLADALEPMFWLIVLGSGLFLVGSSRVGREFGQ